MSENIENEEGQGLYDNMDLDQLMGCYIEVLKKESTIKKIKNAIKSKIQIIIKTEDIDEYRSPDNILLKSTVVARNALDKSLVVAYCEKENIDYSQFVSKSESERLTIKTYKNVEVDGE